MPLLLRAFVDRAPPEADMPEGLRLIDAGGPLCAVTEVDVAPRVTPTTLRLHDETVRRLATLVDALLPAHFGEVLPDDAELRMWVDAHRQALVQALDEVRGGEQMTLRVYGPPPDRPVLTAGAGQGARYLRARQEAARLSALDPLRRRLGTLVRLERIRPHDTGRLRASVHHLIPRGHAADYESAVHEVAPTLAPLHLSISGPWAPYAFGPPIAPPSPTDCK